MPNRYITSIPFVCVFFQSKDSTFNQLQNNLLGHLEMFQPPLIVILHHEKVEIQCDPITNLLAHQRIEIARQLVVM
jgi:hypothetical protein